MDSRKPEHIEKLLEKYWNCESTLEEEQELKNWFAKHGNEEDFREEEALFKYFSLEKKRVISQDSFDDDILEKLDSVKDTKTRRFFISPNLRNLSRIAAGIIVALAATLYVLYEEEPKVPAVFTQDTFENPDEAYAETMKVLNLISEKLNLAKEQTAKISVLNEAEEQVKETEIN